MGFTLPSLHVIWPLARIMGSGLAPNTRGLQSPSHGVGLTGTVPSGTQGSVERSTRALGNAAHPLASISRSRSPVSTAPKPVARPIAVRNIPSVEPAFSHMMCTARSGRSWAATLAVAGMA